MDDRWLALCLHSIGFGLVWCYGRGKFRVRVRIRVRIGFVNMCGVMVMISVNTTQNLNHDPCP